MKKFIAITLLTFTLATILTSTLHHSSFIIHHSSELLTGLAVAGACLLVAAGILIGALWTYASIRAGARLATPGYLAHQHTQTETTRAIRDGLRILSPPPPPSDSPHWGAGGAATGPWLPPLQDFTIIDHDDIKKE